MLIIIYNIYIIYYYNIIYIVICNLSSSEDIQKTTLLLFVICYLLFCSWFSTRLIVTLAKPKILSINNKNLPAIYFVLFSLISIFAYE